MSRMLRIASCMGVLTLASAAHANLPPNLSHYKPSHISRMAFLSQPAPVGTSATIRINNRKVTLTPQQSQALMQLLAPLIRKAVVPLLSAMPLLVGKAPLRLDLLDADTSTAP